jgi:hypothetical protein
MGLRVHLDDAEGGNHAQQRTVPAAHQLPEPCTCMPRTALQAWDAAADGCPLPSVLRIMHRAGSCLTIKLELITPPSLQQVDCHLVELAPASIQHDQHTWVTGRCALPNCYPSCHRRSKLKFTLGDGHAGTAARRTTQ